MVFAFRNLYRGVSACYFKRGVPRSCNHFSFILLAVGLAAHSMASASAFVAKGYERRQATWYAYSSGWTSSSNHHMFQVYLYRPARATSYGSGTYTLSDVAIWIPEECKGSKTTSGQSTSVVDVSSHASGSSYTYTHALTFSESATANEYVAVDVPVSSSYSTTTVAVLRVTTSTTYDSTTNLQIGTPSYSSEEIRLDVAQVSCGKDASIDERKGYQSDGNEADPNSAYSSFNFGSTTFKGGLFAGKYTDHHDKSGESRIQIGATQLSGSYLFATLSMMFLGTPDDFSGTLKLGAYIPSSPASWTEGGVTWESKFAVTPRSTPGSPIDLAQDCIDYQEFTTSSPPIPKYEFANWTLYKFGDSAYPVPTSYENVCIAAETASNPKWAYFASKEYSGQFTDATTPWSTAPDDSYKSCGPRIWVVKEAS